MRKINTALILTAVIALAISSFFRHAHNEFVDKAHLVEVALGRVEIEVERRNLLLDRSRSALKQYITLEGEIFGRLTELNGLIKAGNTGNKGREMKSGILALIARLEMIREAYPELKVKDPYLYFMETVQDAGRRVTSQRLIYNEAAYEFNSMLNIFPYKSIAWLLRYEKEPFFRARDGAEELPVIEPLLRRTTLDKGITGPLARIQVSPFLGNGQAITWREAVD